jgi:hypothetical protein
MVQSGNRERANIWAQVLLLPDIFLGAELSE